MGGLCFGEPTFQQPKQPVPNKPPIQKVDEVKFKLKKARDTIKTFITAKTRDLGHIEQRIAEKVPAFKQTGNKKQLIPLLKAKKDLLAIIDSGDVRLKLVSQKLDEVEMQQINAETIDVLDESNKYVREIQEQLEKKDWRDVLNEAQKKYSLDWPDQKDEESDPAFQQMWRQLGGDKLAPQSSKTTENKTIQKIAVENKTVEKKGVRVEIGQVGLGKATNAKKMQYA